MPDLSFRLQVFVNTNQNLTVPYGNGFNGPPALVPTPNPLLYTALGYSAPPYPSVYRACGFSWLYMNVLGTEYDFWRSPVLSINASQFHAVNLSIDVWDLNPELDYSNPTSSGSVLEAMGVLISNYSAFYNYQWLGQGDARAPVPYAPPATSCLISNVTDQVSLYPFPAPPPPIPYATNPLSYGGNFASQSCYTNQPALFLTFLDQPTGTDEVVSIATFLKMTYTPAGGSPTTMLFINDPEMILDTP